MTYCHRPLGLARCRRSRQRHRQFASLARGLIAGQPNAEAVGGFVADTKFDGDPQFFHGRGFYDAPFDVTVTTATLGATLVYTTNGTAPSVMGTQVLTGTAVVASDDQTPPTATVHIDATSTLRVMAFKEGLEPTNVDTQTYIFAQDVIQQRKFQRNGVHFGMDPGIVNDNLIVFASGKDRQNANAELHTNFKLGAKGEYLTLIHSAGSTTEQVSFFGPRYPKQERGISFGLAPEGSTGTLSVPTPGGRNTEVVMGDLGPVQFSHQRSMCESPFRLVLTNASPPAVIYYTTDGTIPTSATPMERWIN